MQENQEISGEWGQWNVIWEQLHVYNIPVANTVSVKCYANSQQSSLERASTALYL